MEPSVLELMRVSMKGEEPERVPVVLLAYGLVLKSIHGVKELEYYMNAELQLEAKVEFLRMFPEAYNMQMGTLPEYGEFVGPIPTAFGAELGWHDDSPPYVASYPISSPEDVDKLVEAGIPDPWKDGVAPKILERYEMFVKRFPRDLKEEYEYVEGNVYPGLLVEGAALAMGYDKFLLWLRLHPDVVHKWLRAATDFYLKYIEAIEQVVGKCKYLFIPDHTASMVNREQFKEFVLPYLNRVFSRYPKALKIWHNEGYVGHMLEEVDKIQADVWHLGPREDIAEVKRRTRFVACGQLHPPKVAKATPKQVEEWCKELIAKYAEGGRFWLSTGGGMAPGTTAWHIRAFIRASIKYSALASRR